LAEAGFGKAVLPVGPGDEYGARQYRSGRGAADTRLPTPRGRAPVARARAYRDRLPAQWDVPYGYPRACEWTLHTWDLAHVLGRGHRPSDAASLYAATGAGSAAAESGLKGRVAAVLIPLGTHLRPWEAILRRSGRAPGPDD
jgi:hypothetical protein